MVGGWVVGGEARRWLGGRWRGPQVVGWQVERPTGGWVVGGEAHRWLGGRWRGPQVVGW